MALANAAILSSPFTLTFSNWQLDATTAENRTKKKGFRHNHNGTTIIRQAGVTMMKAEASTTTHQCKQKDTQLKVDFIHGFAIKLCRWKTNSQSESESFSYHLLIFTVNPSFFVLYAKPFFSSKLTLFRFFFILLFGKPAPYPNTLLP